jgi:hypothetical protein
MSQRMSYHQKSFSRVYLNEQVTANLVLLLIQNVLVVSLDLSANHVRLVHLSMTMDMGSASLAQTNLQILTIIALRSSVTNVHTNVQMVLKM